MSGDEMDLGALFRQAQELQEQLAEAQERAADREVEGRAGGGAVVVTVTGAMEFRSVRIDPAAVDPDDVAMLEDLVLAALHDAVRKAQDLTRDAFGGVDLGSLFGGGPPGGGVPGGGVPGGGLSGLPGLPGPGGPGAGPEDDDT